MCLPTSFSGYKRLSYGAIGGSILLGAATIIGAKFFANYIPKAALYAGASGAGVSFIIGLYAAAKKQNLRPVDLQADKMFGNAINKDATNSPALEIADDEPYADLEGQDADG